MNIRPLNDNIVVEYVEESTKIPGGIIIPDTAKEAPKQATVLAIGNGKRNKKGERQEVEVGNIVIFSQYSGNEITVNNKKYRILKEEDIIGIIEQ